MSNNFRIFAKVAKFRPIWSRWIGLTFDGMEPVDCHESDDQVWRRSEHRRQRRQNVDVNHDGVDVADAVVRLDVCWEKKVLE